MKSVQCSLATQQLVDRQNRNLYTKWMPLVVKFGEISERFQIICARLLPKPPQPLPHPSLLHLQPLLLILRCSLNLSRRFLRISSSSSSLSSSSASSSSIATPSHKHIAHLLLDQKSASQALQTFKWASKLPNFIHSPSTYRALIHKLCTFHCFDTVHQLLDEMPTSIGQPPDEDIFVTIIRGLGRAHMVKQVINVLDLIYKYEKMPSLKVFNSILDVLVKEDIDIAREFYRKKMMESGVQGDDYTFGILMKGLCLTNRIGDGFKLLQAMKSRGITPNTVVYNTLLHALCKNKKVGRARSLMNEMEAPNDVTFNVLISGYCGEENLVQALVLLEKCFGLGFVPDVVTVTKVLEILCSDGRVMEAVKVIERVESKGGLVDVVAYNTLIKGFCRLGKAKLGLRIVKEMERKGCLPNVDTYNVLISGFCESGMLDMALDLFNDMKTDGINWNFVTYDTLIRYLCSGGRTKEGFEILELMNERKGGSLGQISPYNSVLYGLYKEHRLDEALEFLTNMGKLFPRAVDRSLRILGFCEEGATENAKRVYNQIIMERGVPSVFIYDCLIHRYCKEGCIREAFELLNEMIAHGYFPLALTFNSLISGFCEQGKVGSALKLLEDMVERGCSPDARSYSPLVAALCHMGDFQKALRLVLQMVEKGIIPDYFTWNSLLICLSQETVWLKGKSILDVNNLIHCIIEN
ncbi:pentatricopeptide repeat-containing protein [Prunus yedoensis var. nudiflora]|uniref:Pentatricopeptide repeat-containing protein n=1 Tax=Prunus yedoensis var. nudiflora TaxID=2094558 RepID=A0A314Y7I0_PRUYE|nr:pentatricopeptide repeat-containing protein [Prunus yedoensis var. nudiflora]